VVDEMLEHDDLMLDPPPSGGMCGDHGGITKAGAPCRSRLNLSPTSGRCLQHDADRAESAHALRIAGGRASGMKQRMARAALPEGAPKAPRTLEDAVRIAAWITRATLVGEIDVRVSEAATKAVRQFQLGEEKRAMQKELVALRTQLAALKKPRGRVA